MKRAFLLSLICLLSLSSVGKSAGNNLSKTEINNKLNNEVISSILHEEFSEWAKPEICYQALRQSDPQWA